MSKISIQLGLDKQTGFPCLRADRQQRYVAFFPITKFQVEEWIWSGGLLQEEDPYRVSQLIERLELRGPLPSFPQSVKQLERAPILKLTQGNAPSMLATNLTLWNADEDLQRQPTKFPTPASEWGRIKDWLRGDVPDLELWRSTRKFYSQFKTKDLALEIFRSNLRWTSSVRQLLNRFYKDICDSEDVGLPFMNSCIYELVTEPNRYVKVTASPLQSVWRPMVVGKSPIWPVLGNANSDHWRPVLQQSLPVVGLRLWFEEGRVKDAEVDNIPNTIQVESHKPAPVLSRSDVQPESTSGALINKLRSFVSRGPSPMTNRCPLCYEDVAEEVFQGKEIFWCYRLRDAESGKLNPSHSRTRPRGEGIDNPEPVDPQYLEIARKRPGRVLTVCLSGHTKTGKTIWLLSLLGITLYPAGKTLQKIFPKSWKFDRIECSLAALNASDLNLLHNIDGMWVDGNVPDHNSAKKRALRSPVIFRLTPPGRLFQKEHELVLIFNDIAGELVANPPEIIDNEDFRHLPATTDVVFLTPADNIHVADQLLGKFANGLAAQSFGKRNLNLKQINLILAISQIDLLSDKTDQGRELSKILLSEPHSLPTDQSEEELRNYFNGMVSVHFQLEAWLRDKQPLLFNAAQRFGAVRYCGFSSFGFQLINESRRPGSDACLPFEPEPIRVADPLLWLLREQRMFGF